jgi:hypothetical protein
MEETVRKIVESAFRQSASSGELFDALKLAIKHRIEDVELYKILLGNPSLSKYELIMFTEKICKDFEDCSYEIYLWSARVFESRVGDSDFTEDSLYFYEKAFLSNPEEHSPLIGALNLFNYDYEIPANQSIMSLIDLAIPSVSKKSMVYRSLYEHFKKTGNKDLMARYLKLAQIQKKREN